MMRKSSCDSEDEMRSCTQLMNFRFRYHRVCETVFKEGPQRAVAIKIIGWTLCAARSLKWREVQAAFYLNSKRNVCNYNHYRLRKDCKPFCDSLVDLNKRKKDSENEAVLEIVHDTARK